MRERDNLVEIILAAFFTIISFTVTHRSWKARQLTNLRTARLEIPIPPGFRSRSVCALDSPSRCCSSIRDDSDSDCGTRSLRSFQRISCINEEIYRQSEALALCLRFHYFNRYLYKVSATFSRSCTSHTRASLHLPSINEGSRRCYSRHHQDCIITDR